MGARIVVVFDHFIRNVFVVVSRSDIIQSQTLALSDKRVPVYSIICKQFQFKSSTSELRSSDDSGI